MEASLQYARAQDQADELKSFRDQFYFPTTSVAPESGSAANPTPQVYLCGNSLGLQPKGTEAFVERLLEAWKQLAIGGYFKGEAPWMTYAQRFKEPLAQLVGARSQEISVMNTLTVNLHLLLCTFYKPKGERYKLLIEKGAFPSDQYAAQTQVRFHGYEPADALVEVGPRPGEKVIRPEDILEAIAQHGSSLALVLIGGVNYYTGQFFDIKSITQAAHEIGALAGFDLAHAVGNVPLRLHDDDADFAVWCSYKYLNGGPGASGAVYIHERFSSDPALGRFGGWGGSLAKTRFDMPDQFTPEPGADGWNLSVAQGLVLAGLEASLEIFQSAGIEKIRAKSIRLTGYLEFLLNQIPGKPLELITPNEPESRGAQLSLYFPQGGKQLQAALQEAGIVVDYREPGVIRVSPAPLYNNFEDVYKFYEIITHAALNRQG
jgi:kynureninase